MMPMRMVLGWLKKLIQSTPEQVSVQPKADEPIGVTLGWDCHPTRLFRRPDGSTYINFADRRRYPEAYDENGWPIGLDIADGRDGRKGIKP